MDHSKYPCGGEKKGPSLMGPPVDVKPVDQCQSIMEVFRYALPAFGGAILRRVYTILYNAILEETPLIIAVAGPVSVSNQTRAWLIPLLKTGWVGVISTTDAVCYHDGHDSLEHNEERPIRTVELHGDDGAYREAGIIRVTDTGFPEEVLYKQDSMISAMLGQPEFQRHMTTTERNNLFGKYYAAQEKAFGVAPGLLSTCYELGIPIHVGAPRDGSAELNAVKMRMFSCQGHGKEFRYDIDTGMDVFEFCSYHYWGLQENTKKLAILILGGGVPKNYALQPEPTLSQIFRLHDIRGYDSDVQIVSAPVTDGSLSSCYASEAVTWGKVDPETYRKNTESLQGDFSCFMPFIVYSLLQEPALKRRPQLRLFDQREQLIDKLRLAINWEDVRSTLDFPLQLLKQDKTRA
jgi:deoxyhypusine synthase